MFSLKSKEEKPYDFKKDKINPDAFKQTTFWYNRQGKQYRITDMNFKHIVNAMNLIVEHYPKQVGSPLWKAMAKHRNYTSYH